MARNLPIDNRIVLQSARATVTNLIDGIVELITNSKIKVAPPKHIERNPRKGGFISDFKADNGSKTGENQRILYEKDTGLIYINIKFPSINKFIREGLKGVETSEGRVLLSELVGEVFFRQLARDAIEKEGYIKGTEGLIDAFNLKINEFQKKYLHKIQDIIFTWKFSPVK
jgi:hypothetical protein